MPAQTTPIKRVLYSVPEAREVLGGIGTTLFYELAKVGEINLVHLNRRSFVTPENIERVVASRVMNPCPTNERAASADDAGRPKSVCFPEQNPQPSSEVRDDLV